jgi:hypothetical protein
MTKKTYSKKEILKKRGKRAIHKGSRGGTYFYKNGKKHYL